MSFLDLYMNRNPLITGSDEGGDPVATIFGVPFDATHSYKPGCRFGADAIRDSFNNIEIFHPELGVDLETVNIEGWSGWQDWCWEVNAGQPFTQGGRALQRKGGADLSCCLI